MEWLTCIRKAIDYMEEHLEDDISAQDVADQVFMSSFFFQKGAGLVNISETAGCTWQRWTFRKQMKK